jgi:site-specific recombinase XerD
MKNKNNIRLHDAIALYLERIANEGQSQTSVRTARYALARFVKAVGSTREPNPYLHLVTHAMVDGYCYGPSGIRKDIRAVSFNRYRSVLVVFFNYALLMRWVDTNPMEGISKARPDMPRSMLLLNASELTVLLEQTCNPVERVACSLGMNTGLRANDIKRLTIFDVSLAAGSIQTAIRKTKQLDNKPITMELHLELTRWLDCYADFQGLSHRGELPDDWMLVPSYRNAAPAEPVQHIHLRPHGIHTHP